MRSEITWVLMLPHERVLVRRTLLCLDDADKAAYLEAMEAHYATVQQLRMTNYAKNMKFNHTKDGGPSSRVAHPGSHAIAREDGRLGNITETFRSAEEQIPCFLKMDEGSDPVSGIYRPFFNDYWSEGKKVWPSYWAYDPNEFSH